MLLVALFLTTLLCFATIILVKIIFEYINNKIQEKEQERQEKEKAQKEKLKAQKEKEHRDSIQKRDDEIIDLVMGYYINNIIFNFHSFERLLINEYIEYNIYSDNSVESHFYIYLHETKVNMCVYKIKEYDKVQITSIVTCRR